MVAGSGAAEAEPASAAARRRPFGLFGCGIGSEPERAGPELARRPRAAGDGRYRLTEKLVRDFASALDYRLNNLDEEDESDVGGGRGRSRGRSTRTASRSVKTMGPTTVARERMLVTPGDRSAMDLRERMAL